MKQAAEKLKLWTGCRGLHPRLQGQTDRARVQMEEQADIRTTVKQVDRKMGCMDSCDRVKVNSSYEMSDRLWGRGQAQEFTLSLVWCVQQVLGPGSLM